MVRAFEVFVLSLAVCSATGFSVQSQIVETNEIEPKSAIDDSLRNLLEDLRYSLRCGFPEQGIPPLAPLHIESAKINERGLLYNVQGNVRNLTVSGLDGYTVDVATLNVLTLRAAVGVTFPKISLNTLYDMDALLLSFIPIFGHGRLAFDVKDLSVHANGRLTLSLRTGRLNLTTMDIDVNLGSTFTDSTGVYDSRIVSTFFNIGLERMVRNIFDNNKENLETTLENLLIPVANQYLNELTLQDLLGLIGGSSDANDGPHLDPETGELICHANEEATTTTPTTTEYVPSTVTNETQTETQPDDITSSTSEQTTTEQTTISTSTELGIESTTLEPPDDASNSSHFSFAKFQMMFLTIVPIVTLRIL